MGAWLNFFERLKVNLLEKLLECRLGQTMSCYIYFSFKSTSHTMIGDYWTSSSNLQLYFHTNSKIGLQFVTHVLFPVHYRLIQYYSIFRNLCQIPQPSMQPFQLSIYIYILEHKTKHYDVEQEIVLSWIIN